MTVLVVVLLLVVLLLGVLVAGLLRSHAEILRALHDLGVNLDDGHTGPRTFDVSDRGSQEVNESGLAVPVAGPLPVAQDLRGVTPEGDAVQVALLGANQPTLLAFLSSGCTTCLDFWSELARHRGAPAGVGARVVAVTKGPDAESPSAVAELAPPDVVTIMSTEAYEDFGVGVAPYFVLVDARRGVIGEGAARTWSQLAGLLEKAVADGVVAGGGAQGALSRRDVLSGRARRDLVDDELARAGIIPGDPSLYEDPHAGSDGPGEGGRSA